MEAKIELTSEEVAKIIAARMEALFDGTAFLVKTVRMSSYGTYTVELTDRADEVVKGDA